MALNNRQQRFVEEYLIDLNATQAAMRAGYSARTANEQGARLLTHESVSHAIEEGRKARSERTQITQDRVLLELGRIAFLDARKFFTASGNPIPLQDLDDDTAAAVAGLDIVVERTEAAGNGFAEVRKYKIADKLSALQAAMRHLGMYKDKVELTGKDGGPLKHQNVTPDLSSLTADELNQLAKLAAKLGAPAES